MISGARVLFLAKSLFSTGFFLKILVFGGALLNRRIFQNFLGLGFGV